MVKDEELEAAIQKGGRLLLMMQAGNQEGGECFVPRNRIAQSAFNDISELSKHGYIQHEATASAIQLLSPVLQDLNVSDKTDNHGGNNISICHLHDKNSGSSEKTYPKTGAYFTQICNPTDGILIADSNRSAPHAGPLLDDPVTEFPPLRQWSDVAFLQYLSSSLDPDIQPSPLRHIFRLTIQNLETVSVLDKIVTNLGYTEYKVWPGVTFDTESEEGLAILGTPNGSGVGWLVAQHKKHFEDRRVRNVTVFYAENTQDLYMWPSLLFSIA